MVESTVLLTLVIEEVVRITLLSDGLYLDDQGHIVIWMIPEMVLPQRCCWVWGDLKHQISVSQTGGIGNLAG